MDDQRCGGVNTVHALTECQASLASHYLIMNNIIPVFKFECDYRVNWTQASRAPKVRNWEEFGKGTGAGGSEVCDQRLWVRVGDRQPASWVEIFGAVWATWVLSRGKPGGFFKLWRGWRVQGPLEGVGGNNILQLLQ